MKDATGSSPGLLRHGTRPDVRGFFLYRELPDLTSLSVDEFKADGCLTSNQEERFGLLREGLCATPPPLADSNRKRK